MIPLHIQERFHRRYDFSMVGCWNWTASATKNGYGNIGWMFNGVRNNILAHRMSYELYNGSIPPELVIRHTCDNTRCVNPNHLILGTYSENQTDMFDRWRDNKVYGIKQGQAKLTEQQVIDIRSKYIPNVYSMDKLANEYGVRQSTISLIIREISWKHLL